MIIISARRTWITLRKLRSIQATPAVAQTMIMARNEPHHWADEPFS